ncbi:Oxysterol-binding protein [Stereum hirsutum FP-91666 SS1]|uniref:Oxysterol-binding protein n=1 Tax=Stereum hirsutum (strain FP-91666) TaxID=721885 RepID=UPI000444982D|nr:Oxysterol-binding protein [Stereum hirsutum FP-91666 SS1]EIM84272.1 Oxysterol-binding protein [Stereum hirsutum FP-91666 SS1]
MTDTPSNEQVGEAVPSAQRSSWTSFLKSIASFSGDLSSMTAPPFILSPVSLTEFPAYWCERPELFAAIADGKTPEERHLAVLKWFISTLKGQYTSRNESMGSEKKPLNPVLGELFYGYWPDTNGRGQTNLVVEQVSHHPPITAYYISNPSKGLALQGHNAQKTSFSGGSIIVKQIGHASLTVDLPDGNKEEYIITLPRLRIDGLWYGSPYIELAETSWISSSSGWLSTIEYKGKGYFSGKTHSFKATVTAQNGAQVHVIEGQWHTTSKSTKSSANFTDVTGPKEEVTVQPIDAQDEWESRKLWGKVAAGIRGGDFETASREKSKIENEQRQRRKDEVAAGTKWELKHFVHVDEDPLYERLGKAFKASPPTEDMYVFQNNAPTFGPSASSA